MSDRALRATILSLSVLGAAVAGYLTIAHVVHAQVACATGGCETVQTSSYSEIAGVPVAALGLAGYLLLGGTAVCRRSAAAAVGLAAALTGFAVGMVLLYVQAGVLHAFCQWCLTSDAVLVALVPLTGLRALRAAPQGATLSSPARHPAGRAPARREARRPPRR